MSVRGDRSIGMAEKLVKSVWTPDTVGSFIDWGLHKPLRSFLLCVLTWTTIGLLVSAVFFSRSFAAVLPFLLLGIFTGLLLPRFLLFKSQELPLAARRGADA